MDTGWTLLPDRRGARMHLLDPARDGWTACGRPRDPGAPVHPVNPGFDACGTCRQRTPTPPAPAARTPAGAAPTGAAPTGAAPAGAGRTSAPGQPLRVAAARLRAAQRAVARVPAPRGPGDRAAAAQAAAARMATDRAATDRTSTSRTSTRAGTAQVTGRGGGGGGASRASGSGAAGVSGGGEVQRAAATWRRPGWAVLRGSAVAHRPHPEQPGTAMCGLRLPAGTGVLAEQPDRHAGCDSCAVVRIGVLQRQRAAEHDAAQRAAAQRATERRAREAARRAARPTAARQSVERRAGQPAGSPVRVPVVRVSPAERAAVARAARAAALERWRKIGWVLLPGPRGGRLHRPDPYRVRRTLCQAPIPDGTGVQAQPAAGVSQCSSCTAELRRARQRVGLAAVRVSAMEQDRLDRARARGTSVWTYHAGLPSLGRDY